MFLKVVFFFTFNFDQLPFLSRLRYKGVTAIERVRDLNSTPADLVGVTSDSCYSYLQCANQESNKVEWYSKTNCTW